MTGAQDDERRISTGGWSSMKRLVLFLSLAAATAALVFGFFQSYSVWDNPARSRITIASDHFSYKGNRILVTVSCDCPPYLIESRKQDLQLTFDMKRTSQGNPTSPEPTQPAPPSKTGTHVQLKPTKVEALSLESPDSWVYVSNESSTALVSWQGYSGLTLFPENRLISGAQGNVTLSVTANEPDPVQLNFDLQGWDTKTNQWGQYFEPNKIGWSIPVRKPFLIAIRPFIYSAIVFACALGALFLIDRRFRQLRKRTEQQLLEIRSQAAKHPDESHFAWESARVKLEAYFDRNLIQVNLVFWLAVFVMTVGFAFVLVGVYLALRNSQNFSGAALAAISGIITQFIGATFLVIYRSTMRQANEFMSVLERINTVGMAVHELDRIPDEQRELKNEVRAHLVASLVGKSRLHPTINEDDLRPPKREDS